MTALGAASGSASRTGSWFGLHRRIVRFEDESEIRLIQPVPASVLDRFCQFLPAEEYIKPYVVLSCSSKAIREIVIGPTKYKTRAQAGVQALLTSKGLAAQVSIVRPKVPFRNG